MVGSILGLSFAVPRDEPERYLRCKNLIRFSFFIRTNSWGERSILVEPTPKNFLDVTCVTIANNYVL